MSFDGPVYSSPDWMPADSRPPDYDEDGVLVNEHPGRPAGWGSGDSSSSGLSYGHDLLNRYRAEAEAARPPSESTLRFRYAMALGKCQVTDEQWARHQQQEKERADYERRSKIVLPDPLPVPAPSKSGLEILGLLTGWTFNLVAGAFILLIVVVIAVLGWQFISSIWDALNFGGCRPGYYCNNGQGNYPNHY
jgi:hypothetical protein